RVAATCTMQLIDSRECQAGAAGSQRVAQSNSTTVGVYARVVVLQAQLTQNGQALRCERLVQFDDIDLVDRDPGVGEDFLRGWSRADTHDARCNTGRRHTNDTGARSQTVL